MKTYQFSVLITILLMTSVSQFVWASTQLRSQPCEVKHEGANCYSYVVEQTGSSSSAISINVQVLPALGEKKSDIPLVWLQGGPGMSNLDPTLPDWIWQQFDVLLVGYRGIDGTPRLDCPTLRRQFKKEVKNKNENFLAASTLERLRNQVTVCQQHWEQQGFDTQQFGIYQVADDIESVRVALGYPKISLLSASYGTRIAWYYDQLFPGTVHRNLILSGNPNGGFFFDPMILERQLEQLEQWCTEDSVCNKKTPALRNTMKTVLNNLPEKAWGVTLDADHLRLVTFMMLYSRQSIPMVIDAYSKAENGNHSGLVTMQKFPNPFQTESWVWGTFFSAGSLELDPNRDYRSELALTAQSTTLNSPLSELVFSGLTEGWKADSVALLETKTSETHTLILGSDFDVATPVERIEQFWMPYLPNGTLIRVEGAGHAPDHVIAGGTALENHLIQFLSGGEAQTDEQFGAPIEWKPKMSLSWLTYGFWGVVGLLSTAAFGVLIVLL